MNTRVIGSTFTDNGTILEVVPCGRDGLCNGCYYQSREWRQDKKRPWVKVDAGLHCHCNRLAAGLCVSTFRDDGVDVKFMRLL